VFQQQQQQQQQQHAAQQLQCQLEEHASMKVGSCTVGVAKQQLWQL
jgi:hypothetical protein